MFDLIRSNKRKSVALIAVFVVLLVAVGAAIGVLIGYGPIATVIALVIAGAMAATLVLEGRRDRAPRQSCRPGRP